MWNNPTTAVKVGAPPSWGDAHGYAGGGIHDPEKAAGLVAQVAGGGGGGFRYPAAARLAVGMALILLALANVILNSVQTSMLGEMRTLEQEIKEQTLGHMPSASLTVHKAWVKATQQDKTYCQLEFQRESASLFVFDVDGFSSGVKNGERTKAQPVNTILGDFKYYPKPEQGVLTPLMTNLKQTQHMLLMSPDEPNAPMGIMVSSVAQNDCSATIKASVGMQATSQLQCMRLIYTPVSSMQKCYSFNSGNAGLTESLSPITKGGVTFVLAK